MEVQTKPWDDWEEELPQSRSLDSKPTVLSMSFDQLQAPSSYFASKTKDFSSKSSLNTFENSKETPAEQILKVLDLPSGRSSLKDLADKFIMIHYINYYERQKLILDLAQNSVNVLLVKLIKSKLSELQNDYLIETAPLKLKLLSQKTRMALSNAISLFKASTVDIEVDLTFLKCPAEEVLVILAKSLLTKYKNLKHKESKVDKSKKNDEMSLPALLDVLDNEASLAKAMEIFAKQHCMENLFYYLQQKEVHAYAATATSPIEKQALKKMIKDIGKDFICRNAPIELNIPSKLRSDFEEGVKDSNINPSLLDPITKEVLHMMLRNTFPTYLKLNK